MADRIYRSFDLAVDASLNDAHDGEARFALPKYLADAHAIEAQATQLLERGPKIAGSDELARLYAEHLEETREHSRLLEERLRANDARPSPLKDAALRLGALNWGAFFQAQPDTAGKLAAFAYAFEHLEIGGYEQLRRVAELAGEQRTVEVVDRILERERGAAAKIAARWDVAVESSLEAVGAAA
jgi:ferritin-like metal-binding protein YciE